MTDSLLEARPLPEVIGLDFLFHAQRTRAPAFYLNRRRQILLSKASRLTSSSSPSSASSGGATQQQQKTTSESSTFGFRLTTKLLTRGHTNEGASSSSSSSAAAPHSNKKRTSVDSLSVDVHSGAPHSASSSSSSLIDRLQKEREQRLRENEIRKSPTSTSARGEMQLIPVNFKYLLLRQTLLARKFGAPPSLMRTGLGLNSSKKSLAQRGGSDDEDDTQSVRKGKSKRDKSVRMPKITKTDESPASRAIVGDTTLDENYAFVGVHNIFDQHRQPVTVIKFANNERNLFCCCSQDSFLSICEVDPPKIRLVLKGHRKSVTDFEWSTANDFIISSSMDKTVRLWDTKNGHCLRTIADESEFLCCSFCPINNNFFVVGERKHGVQVFNLSTGKPLPNNVTHTGAVKAIAFDTAGSSMFVGDEQGVLHVFNISPTSGKLTRVGRAVVSSGHAITSISYSSWFSRERHDPSLLVNCKDNILRFYGVNMSNSNFLKLRNQYTIKQQTYDLRSVFCPLMSFRQGACIVSGSEDNNVYIFDVKSKDRPLVNKLQGHAGPVLCVCWNYDESILGSSDTSGTVILWKRAVVARE